MLIRYTVKCISLSVDASPLDMDQRLEAIEGVLAWSDSTPEELAAIEEVSQQSALSLAALTALHVLL